jgi:hypothetical protein
MIKYIFILSIFFTSCYTKKRAIEKFCHQDTASIVINHIDTLVIEQHTIDSVFSDRVDSIIISDTKIEIRYRKIKDSIYIEGKCKGDTIYKQIKIPIKVPCNCPPPIEPSNWDKIWLWILYILAGYGSIKLLIEIFNKLISK